MTRTAEQIRHTDSGPRPVPPVGARQAPPAPTIVDTVLPNGLRVLLLRQPTVPVVQLRLQIPFADVDPRHPGQAHLLARALFTGTQERNRFAVDADLALVGGSLSAAVNPVRLGIAGWALSSGFDVLLDVMADGLTAAAYRDEEVQHERDLLLQHLAISRTQPDILAREALQQHRYGDHSFAWDLPHPVDVGSVTPDELRHLHERAVVPRGAALVVVGDLDVEQALDQVGKALAGWASPLAVGALQPLPDVVGGDVAVAHNPRSVQSHLCLSAQAVPRTDSRYPALYLANLAFGGYFSSRLNENMREDKGYSYAVRSELETTPDTSTVLLNVETATDTTAVALREIRNELARFVATPPTQLELDRVRRYAIGSLLIATSSQNGLANQTHRPDGTRSGHGLAHRVHRRPRHSHHGAARRGRQRVLLPREVHRRNPRRCRRPQRQPVPAGRRATAVTPHPGMLTASPRRR